MERKEFLALLGMGTCAALTGCLGGCKKDDPSGVDFTLDLSDPANANLSRSGGGYLYHEGVLVARTSGGVFVAVSRYCTHQDTSLEYRVVTNVFHCPNHNAEFGTDGRVVRQPDTGTATD